MKIHNTTDGGINWALNHEGAVKKAQDKLTKENMSGDCAQSFEERSIPELEEKLAPELIAHNRRKADTNYGAAIRQYNEACTLTHEHVRVKSVFDILNEVCFNCDDNGHTPHFETGEPVPCEFCMAEVGDNVLIPSLDNCLVEVSELTADGSLIVVPVTGRDRKERQIGCFAPHDVVKVVWKLYDTNSPKTVSYHGDTQDEVLCHARTEGLFDDDRTSGVSWLIADLSIAIIDGSEDF